MGGDRPCKRNPGHGAGRGLLHRFSDRLRRPALFQMAWPAGRRRRVPALLPLLRQALSPVRRRLCDEREWRRGEAALAGRAARSMSFRWESSSANFRPPSAIRAFAAALGLERCAAAAGLCRPARRRKAPPSRRRRFPPAAGIAWRGACCCLATGRCASNSWAGGRAHFCPRLLPRPQRPRGLAGQRRPLRVGDGRRDVRHFDHRGPGVGASGGRRRRRARWSTACPTASAWSARSTMPTRWQRTSWPCWAATWRRWASGPAPMRCSSAGTRAWSGCSARCIAGARLRAAERVSGRSPARGELVRA